MICNTVSKGSKFIRVQKFNHTSYSLQNKPPWKLAQFQLVKNVPNLQVGWPSPAHPTALYIKVVYVVSYSWYG